MEKAQELLERIQFQREWDAMPEAERLLLQARAYVTQNDEDPDYESAFPYLVAAADKGHTGAQCLLGAMYAEGIYVEQDESEAFRLYLDAAEKGETMAFVDLSIVYLFGTGTAKNLREAKRWAQAAVDAGIEKADTLMQVVNEAWSTCNPDRADMMYVRGLACYERKDFKEANRFFGDAADNYHAQAAYMQGVMDEKGEGGTKSVSGAACHYRDAALWGHTGAFERLKVLAAVERDEDAQFCLAQVYYMNNAVKRDVAEAEKWFEAAVRQEHFYALSYLKTESSEEENKYAQYILGNLYYRGAGVPMDRSKAADLYRLAAAQGYQAAQKALERMS